MDISADGLGSLRAEDCDGACGCCQKCHRSALIATAGHVWRWRYDRRGRALENSDARERAYAARKVEYLADMLGLVDPDPSARARSEWGVAIRERQRQNPK